MKTLIIIVVIVIVYYIIVAVKENESRETIERERKVNNKKIANIHFENLLQNELIRQNMLKEIHKNFILELENEDYINKAFIVENILNIEMAYYMTKYDAAEFADNLVNSLNTATEIDFVNIFDVDRVSIARAPRVKF